MNHEERGALIAQPSTAVMNSADHLLREPLEHLAVEGFEVEDVKRSKAGFVELVTARKPS